LDPIDRATPLSETFVLKYKQDGVSDKNRTINNIQKRNICKKFTNGDKRNAYKILVGKSEGKRPLGRLKRRWVDNIKIGLREIRWDRTLYSLFTS
jgi:hypothetical protein